MAKKRKLNSKNPKWNKELKETQWSKRKLIKEVKGIRFTSVGNK